jgi:hypothetical protein
MGARRMIDIEDVQLVIQLLGHVAFVVAFRLWTPSTRKPKPRPLPRARVVRR